MANVCSAHQGWDPIESPGCLRCNTTIEEFFAYLGVDYKKMHDEAIAAGLYKCKCGFEYYKTVDACPLCNLKR